MGLIDVSYWLQDSLKSLNMTFSATLVFFCVNYLIRPKYSFVAVFSTERKAETERENGKENGRGNGRESGRGKENGSGNEKRTRKEIEKKMKKMPTNGANWKGNCGKRKQLIKRYLQELLKGS